MTEDNKKFLENWRRSNKKIPVKRSKKPIKSTPAVTCTQENISDQTNSPLNFPFGIAPGTESPTIPLINNFFKQKSLNCWCHC